MYWCPRVGETGPVGDWLGGGDQVPVRRRRRDALKASIALQRSLPREWAPVPGTVKSGSTQEAEFKGSGVRDGCETLGNFLSLSVPPLLHSKNEDGGRIYFSTVRHGIVDLKSNIVPST